jgi:hypothetical protein
MNRKVIINGVTYETEKIQAPLADDPYQLAVFPDTSDATADPASVKDGDTFYADGEKKEGTMPVNGDVSGTISTKDGTVTIPAGHTTGGTVGLSSTEKAKLIAGNIRQGVTILGVGGSMSPSEGVNAQSKTVTPTKSQQVVQPDSGYTHLAQVTVGAIPAEYITTTDANAAAADLTKGKTAYVNGKKITGTHTDPAFTLANGVLTIK